jgi:hypothetical protein
MAANAKRATAEERLALLEEQIKSLQDGEMRRQRSIYDKKERKRQKKIDAYFREPDLPCATWPPSHMPPFEEWYKQQVDKK